MTLIAGGHLFTQTVHKGLILNSNQRLHHAAKAQRVKKIRTTAHALLRSTPGWVPFREPVQLYVSVANSTRNRLDPPNFWPTVKAIIDGLVEAGLLADDDAQHITATTFTRAPDKTTRGTYRFDLAFIPKSDPTYVPF